MLYSIHTNGNHLLYVGIHTWLSLILTLCCFLIEPLRRFAARYKIPQDTVKYQVYPFGCKFCLWKVLIFRLHEHPLSHMFQPLLLFSVRLWTYGRHLMIVAHKRQAFTTVSCALLMCNVCLRLNYFVLGLYLMPIPDTSWKCWCVFIITQYWP